MMISPARLLTMQQKILKLLSYIGVLAVLFLSVPLCADPDSSNEKNPLPVKHVKDGAKADSKESSADLKGNENETSSKESSGKETSSKASSSAPSKMTHQQPLINITIYRNGTVLATKKLKADLKGGQQNVVYDKAPKTLALPSLIATLDADDAHVQILGQHVNEESQSLIIDVLSSYEQVKILTLNYLFSGIDWDIFYSGILSPDQKTLILSGWIEVTNHCGSTIENAQIFFNGSSANMTADGLTVIDHSKSDFEYLLPRVITLPMGKKIYMSFIQALHIPLNQENIINVGGDYLAELKGELQRPQIQRVVEFKNDSKLGLNFTLPSGKMTIYQMQTNGLNQYLGTTLLTETPVGGSVPLRIGSDFRHLGITCDLEQTDYKKNSNKSNESGYRLMIHNKNDTGFQVKVVLPVQGYDWSMVRSSSNYEVSGTAPHHQEVYWMIPDITAGSDYEIKYRIKLDTLK
ncbi:MAG: hypothetical protein K2X98_04145 [Alphaproteobacteria bacterium]|nr:hypothetical protein [Alphaproteobacteria bacterium]